jgi:hypothetical protein
MNASGGAAAPLNDASEEFGATAPKHERLGEDDDDETSASGISKSSNRQSNQQSSSRESGNIKSNQQSSTHSSSTSKTTQSSSSHSSSTTTKTTQQSSTGSNDLEQIARDKAQRYTNLNEQDVQHASASYKNVSDAERSSQRTPKDVGPKEDVEQLHGKATLSGKDRDDEEKSGGRQHGSKNSGSGQQDGKTGGGKGESGGKGGVEVEYKGHGLEDPMRHNAEKFVNLDD